MRWPSRIGRWEIRGALGAGGTAEVLLGTDGQREVAVKRPVAERADDPAMSALVRVEAAVLAHLRHENIVSFVELVEGPPPALVIERLHGQTVAELTATSLDDVMRLEIVAQAAAALVAVHAATDPLGPLALVHRDVSPENLFVGEEGIVKLFDFNLACSREHAPVVDAMQGRVAYMAPEQARSEAVAGSADVFSLGVVAWELFAGERLFWRGGTLATLRALVEAPIPRLASRCNVAGAIDEIVARMLDRTAASRPSPSEIVEALAPLRSSASDARARLGAVVRVVR